MTNVKLYLGLYFRTGKTVEEQLGNLNKVYGLQYYTNVNFSVLVNASWLYEKLNTRESWVNGRRELFVLQLQFCFKSNIISESS